MKESTVVKNILKYLRAVGFYAYKTHGGPMQKAGLPDIIAIRDGRYYAFEVKSPTAKGKAGEATKLQEKVIRDLRAHGAVAGVVRSETDVVDLIESDGASQCFEKE